MKISKNSYYCFCFYCCCCCWFLCMLGDAADEDGEATVLLSIKFGLVDPLDKLADWGGASPHCNWTGVGCNAAGVVERLDLSYMNLSGHVTEDLRRLSGLTHLNLCCNQLSSVLPKSLTELPLLELLDVSSNAFSGEFPLLLAGGVRSINASGNDFTGKLPEVLGNVSVLESLDMRGSYFVGSIPGSYAKLGKLRFIGLSGNNLTGRIPPELGRLMNLETVILGYNAFDGPIPAEIGNLSKLRYLDIAEGGITGAIPPEIGKLQLLTTVYLYKNRLAGEIPPEIGNATQLTMLDLSDNSITGRIPPEVANLCNLKLLNLMGNRLVGPIPSAIGELKKLEILSLWNNTLTGTLPPDLGRHSPLQWLDVSSNSLTGEVPGGLCDGGNLSKLILFNNGFTGAIPATLTACLSLVRVRMHSNRINGTIPDGFGNLRRLERLELAGNNLSGVIPDDISKSTSLSLVDLSGNTLESTLPPNILAIPTLQSFMVSGNLLTGGVPDQFQDCPFLTVLDLSSNRLSGEIPASLASCRKLVNLDLSHNSFTGVIPSAFSTMGSLSILDLSNNHLTGSIPSDFGTSPALEMVNLSNNSLTGAVPENGVLRTINPSDLAGNSGLCGAVLPPCSEGSFSECCSRRWIHVIEGWAIGISAVVVAALLALGIRWVYRRWYEYQLEKESSREWPWRLTAFQRVNFTSADVLACVKDANVIGMGASGVVYKAEMPRQRAVVAVKKLWRSSEEEDGEMEGEVGVLGKLRHRNIVRLVGVMRKERETMLVYEYVEKGSLWEALHGGRKELLGDWVGRYNVAAGVAQGLAYLHHDCHPPVIHRDVKSSNILLDGNVEARIADFGLARTVAERNRTLSEVAGSHGYIAPEYGYTLKVDQKSDIYSFGVVLMELLTGRKPIEPEFADSQDLVGWVRSKLRANCAVEDVLDPSIGSRCQHVQEEMMLVLRIAVLCTAKFPKDRPSMRDVVTMLGEAKPRRKSSGTSAAAAAKEKPVFSPSPGPV